MMINSVAPLASVDRSSTTTSQPKRVSSWLYRSERFARFDNLDALRAWADFYVGYERAYQEGCTLGSLAGEIIKTDLHAELASAFDE
jgi:TetR/AcrR family transcriptional repressor of nem operon